MKKNPFFRIVSVVLCLTLLTSCLLCFSIPASAAVGDHEMTERENNNTRPLADVVESDYTVNGYVVGTDVDYFKIGVSVEQILSVVVISSNEYLQLGVDNGAVSLRSTQTELVYVEGAGLAYMAEISVNAAPGTYYIELKNADTTKANEYVFYVFLQDYPHMHTYEKTETVPPTCTEQGYTVYSCSCGDYYYDDYTDTTEHRFSNSYDLYCDDCNAYRIEGWRQESGQWVFYRNSKKCTNTWARDSQGWRYLDADGYMLCNGWARDTRGWCYMNAQGLMVKNAWLYDNPEWYYLDANGYRVTNKWMKDSQGWCYLGSNGSMVCNGWARDSVGWCFMNAQGRMLKNTWKKHGGRWYFLDANGYMVTNKWMKDSQGWCYLGSDGSMATNAWVKDSVGWCYVGEDGYCVTDCWVQDSVGWCYVDANGRLVTNRWMIDDGGWYYMDANGHRATNRWVKDSKGWCYLGEDGYMVTNRWVRDSKGWCYIGSAGYVQPHKNDGCSHTFTEATFVDPPYCTKCGVVNGEAKAFELVLNGEQPIYVDYVGRSMAKITNLEYEMDANGRLHVYFDIEKITEYEAATGPHPIAATFTVTDDENNELDVETYWRSSATTGVVYYDEHIELRLDWWDGSGPVYLTVSDYG